MTFFSQRVALRPAYTFPDKVDAEWASQLILQLQQRDRAVQAVTQLIQLTATFATDVQTDLSVAINFEFGFTPQTTDVFLSVADVTDNNVWRYDTLKLDTITANTLTARINISTASGAGGSTARLNALIRPGAAT